MLLDELTRLGPILVPCFPGGGTPTLSSPDRPTGRCPMSVRPGVVFMPRSRAGSGSASRGGNGGVLGSVRGPVMM